MMQLKISHVTEYAYAQPVRYALQRLRLTPQDSPLQTVHSWNTEVEGGTVEARYVDHFGNVVELVSASRDTEAIKRGGFRPCGDLRQDRRIGTAQGLYAIVALQRDSR
jgi:transglutaminase-like putative cysteine protease